VPCIRNNKILCLSKFFRYIFALLNLKTYFKFRDIELAFEVNQQKAYGVSKYLTD